MSNPAQSYMSDCGWIYDLPENRVELERWVRQYNQAVDHQEQPPIDDYSYFLQLFWVDQPGRSSLHFGGGGRTQRTVEEWRAWLETESGRQHRASTQIIRLGNRIQRERRWAIRCRAYNWTGPPPVEEDRLYLEDNRAIGADSSPATATTRAEDDEYMSASEDPEVETATQSAVAAAEEGLGSLHVGDDPPGADHLPGGLLQPRALERDQDPEGGAESGVRQVARVRPSRQPRVSLNTGWTSSDDDEPGEGGGPTAERPRADGSGEGRRQSDPDGRSPPRPFSGVHGGRYGDPLSSVFSHSRRSLGVASLNPPSTAFVNPERIPLWASRRIPTILRVGVPCQVRWPRTPAVGFQLVEQIADRDHILVELHRTDSFDDQGSPPPTRGGFRGRGRGRGRRGRRP